MSDDQTICPNCGTPNQPGTQFCRNCGEPLSPETPELVGATAAAGSVSDQITQITNPLMSLGPEAPVAAILVASLQRVLDTAGPREGELLRRCAVPRWFDSGVLSQLREREEGNERALTLIQQYSFVRRLDEQRYTYQDDVRAILLGEWRQQRQAEFEALNRRLASYFALRAERAAPPPEPATNGERNTPVPPRPTGEWQLYIREGIYHDLVVDPHQGMDRLRDEFDRAEADYRLADAEALLQVARDLPLGIADEHWLSYLHARLDHDMLRLDDAAQRLTALIDSPDPLLAAFARRTLAEVHAETGIWTPAIGLYQQSIEAFEAADRPRDAAQTMLLLGETLQEIGGNAGGWHVPNYPHNRFFRALGKGWYWILALPFRLVLLLLQRVHFTLPPAEYLGFYQNWPLIWVYRTAQRWYGRARDAFHTLGDDVGELRAEQQLAQILLRFGHAQQALTQLDALRSRPAARDPYIRAWIDRDRAAALLALGDIAGARRLIERCLAYYHEIGDIRREAAALALQGRALSLAGDDGAALDGYRASLARYRTLNYTPAREQVLYDLRVWLRSVSPEPPADQIIALLESEPEKRFVARFPRSLQPYLQLLSLAAIPLALLLTAFVAPTEVVQFIAGGQPLSLQTFYDPRRIVVVLVLLVALYLAAYTLVALFVIFVVPRRAIEREQPDFIVTDPSGITRYDAHGAQAEQLHWADIGRFIIADRRIWARPAALFSQTFLEDNSGSDLKIDGIVGWYGGLKHEIAYQLRRVGNQVAAEDMGFTILRSKTGALAVVGALLLLLFISSANNWSQWLLQFLPPTIYAALSVVAFSGVVILWALAYWGATQPLQVSRELELRNLWPYVVGVAGLGAIAIYFIARQPTPLVIGLLIWGAYMLAEAAYTIVLPRQRVLGRALTIIAPLLAFALTAMQINTHYQLALSQAGANHAAMSTAANGGEPTPAAIQSADTSVNAASSLVEGQQSTDRQKAEAALDAGRALAAIGRHEEAIRAYQQSFGYYQQFWASQGSSPDPQIVGTLLYNAAVSLKAIGQPWQPTYDQACTTYPQVCAQAPLR